MISRLIKQALAGLQYVLTLAVSVIVVIVAVVAFRSIVDDSGGIPTPTTTTAAVVTTPVIALPIVTSPVATFDCHRDAPQGDETTIVVRLFYACGSANEPDGGTWVYREIDAEGGILTLTMQELVAGPDATERSDGFRSLFSAATAGAVITVAQDEGAVTVDLRDLGPLPSLGLGVDSTFFLADLNNTIFQYEDIARVEYRIEGSCDRFWAYFRETECRVTERETWQANAGAARG